MINRWLCIVVAILCCLLAVVASAADGPATFIEMSAVMRDARDQFSAGVISGSLYNKHPSKRILVTQITIESTAGTRLFRVQYVVPPLEFVEVYLPTGLRLDFQRTPKDSWTYSITKAEWQTPPQMNPQAPKEK